MHEVVHQTLLDRYPVLYGEASPRCGSGWFPILDYIGYWATHGPQLPDHPLRASQVKEKFGALRVYFQWPAAEIHRHMAWLCGEWSLHTCEICGAVGERRVSLGGWVETRCHEHIDYPTREDYSLPPRVEAMLSPTATLKRVGLAGNVRISRPPLAGLSSFAAVDAEGQPRTRETFLRELAVLVDGEAVSPQMLALMCVAAAAMEVACEHPDQGIPTLRARASEFAKTPRAAKQMEILMRTWRRA